MRFVYILFSLNSSKLSWNWRYVCVKVVDWTFFSNFYYDIDMNFEQFKLFFDMRKMVKSWSFCLLFFSNFSTWIPNGTQILISTLPYFRIWSQNILHVFAYYELQITFKKLQMSAVWILVFLIFHFI